MLNCEMGLIIECERLTTRVRRRFHERLPAQAYEVSLGEGASLRWNMSEHGNHRIARAEAKMSFMQVELLRLFRMLPIRWLG